MENQNEIVISQQNSKKGVIATIALVVVGAAAGLGVVKYLKNRKAKKENEQVEFSEDSNESEEN